MTTCRQMGHINVFITSLRVCVSVGVGRKEGAVNGYLYGRVWALSGAGGAFFPIFCVIKL